MVKVSVVIPVYNVEKYIRKALDSVIEQTLTDIEKYDIQEKFSLEFKLPVYFLDNEEHIKNLMDAIIEILS